MHARFWVKTALYRLTPGGFGYYRRLHRLRDPAYDPARDLDPVRARHNGSSGWGDEQDGLRQREYASYDEYVVHQRQKLDEMIKLNGGFTNRVVAQYRLKFFRRFRDLVGLLPPEAQIVCLGARAGTEVEVLRDLGFANAYGVDLNPGPDNPLVRAGDFQRLELPEGSVDLVYSNCVDHAYDLDAFFREHARVLKPNGYALYDLPVVNSDGSAPFESVVWSRDDVVLERLLPLYREVVRRERDAGWEWILLRRPAAAVAAGDQA